MEKSENIFLFESKINPINSITNKINNILDTFSSNSYISTFMLLFVHKKSSRNILIEVLFFVFQ